MTIRDVTEKTGLTRKAIAYYEQAGLIRPERSPGGYRLYSQEDMATLREIALLRRIGLGVADIARFLAAPDKATRLALLETQMALEDDRHHSRRRVMAQFIQSGYDVRATADYTARELDPLAPVRERLLLAFPGGYGLFLHLHFGRFLEGAVDTPEKAAAYEAIIRFLDDAAAPGIPPEIDRMARDAHTAMSLTPGGTAAYTEEALRDMDAYLDQNRESIEAYIAFRTSDAFADSEAGRMQQLMKDFQAQTGYNEVFLPAMRRLSPAYNAYIAHMEAANAKLLARYPELEQMK